MLNFKEFSTYIGGFIASVMVLFAIFPFDFAFLFVVSMIALYFSYKLYQSTFYWSDYYRYTLEKQKNTSEMYKSIAKALDKGTINEDTLKDLLSK